MAHLNEILISVQWEEAMKRIFLGKAGSAKESVWRFIKVHIASLSRWWWVFFFNL